MMGLVWLFRSSTVIGSLACRSPGRPAAMIGRKTVTYSKRRPLATAPGARDDREAARAPAACPAPSAREDAVAAISRSVRELAIEAPPLPCRSRKSEIRPRLSVAPSREELGQLLQCCGQETETPFAEWYGGMKSYRSRPPREMTFC